MIPKMKLLIAIFLYLVTTVSSINHGCTDRLYTEYLTANACATKRRCPYPGYAEYELQGVDDPSVCLYRRVKGSGRCIPNCVLPNTYGTSPSADLNCVHKHYCDRTCDEDFVREGTPYYCNEGTLTGGQICLNQCQQYQTNSTESIICAHGEECVPTCRDGYKNTGYKAECNNGTFTNDVVCRKPCNESAIYGASQGVTCDSKDSADETDADGACLPTCNTNMTRSGEAYCFDGTLTSTATCEDKCPLVIPNNAVAGNCPTSMDSQSSCQLSCATGMIPVAGTTEATCNNGTFSATLQCEPLCSSTPTYLDKGTLGADCSVLYPGGPPCSFTCNGGYAGTGSISCDANNNLINTANCDAQPCLYVPYYAENMIDGSCYDLVTGGECTPECELGFHGNGERWSCSAGEWEANDFQCIPRDPTLFMYYDPSSQDFAWNGQDDLCHRQGKYAHLTVDGQIQCEFCNYTKFLTSYHKSIIETTVHRSYRHGSCCINTHHLVCNVLLNEYKAQCESELKGVASVNQYVGSISGSNLVVDTSIQNVGLDVVATFDDRMYQACSIDSLKVIWNGVHNLQEVTETGYDTCSQDEYIGNTILGFQQQGKEYNLNLNAILGETRYFICTSHCASGAKFKLNCPNTAPAPNTTAP